MSKPSALSSQFHALPVDARRPAARLLRQIAHDIQSPLGTLAMEVFSARMLLNQLERSSSGLPEAQGRKALADLNAISANMERASNQLAEYLNQLTTLEAADDEPPR